MINKHNLFDYVKDHVAHFGFFPNEYEEITTREILKYPDYMKLFTEKQRKELSTIFNSHPEYTN